MGAVQLPRSILTRIAALEAEVKTLRKRAPLGSAQISRGDLVIQGGSLVIQDTSGNPLIVVGTAPDSRVGILVNDNTGDPQVRIGQLASGGYGLEAVDASGDLVQLSTLAFGLASSFLQIFPAEATSSTSFTDLATVGPSVTVEIGNSGRALVILSALITTSASRGGVMGFAVSGATAIAPDQNHSLAFNAQDTNPTSNVGGNYQGSAVFEVTNLNPGSNTFTCKYMTMFSGGVAFGPYRAIAVLPY